jgi:multicomponent Na+:H+ antiporter subunit F
VILIGPISEVITGREPTEFIFVMLAAAMSFAFLRLAFGPTLADRIVVLEVVSMTTAGITITFAVHTGQPAFLDVALVIALISFVGTIAFSRYLERGARQ